MDWRAATLCLLLAIGAPRVASEPLPADSLLLAITTSVRDSGLLDQLLPVFEKGSGIRVRVVAVGTGAALRMGGHGDADLLLTHAPSAEESLVSSGAALSLAPAAPHYHPQESAASPGSWPQCVLSSGTGNI